MKTYGCAFFLFSFLFSFRFWTLAYDLWKLGSVHSHCTIQFDLVTFTLAALIYNPVAGFALAVAVYPYYLGNLTGFAPTVASSAIDTLEGIIGL